MQPRSAPQKMFVVLLLLLIALPALAHNINYAMERAPGGEVAWFYGKLGVAHIIPLGLDHILFVVGLCLLSTKFKPILWQATAFTVAHSITLVLSTKGTITLPASVVEPIIAMSILFIAVENLLLNELKPWRVGIVFLFGLIHGLGFAGALDEIGLPRNKFFTAILSFNLGVEIGQIIVIAAVFLLLIIPLGKKPWYKKGVVYPLSIAIALMAAYWTVQRLVA